MADDANETVAVAIDALMETVALLRTMLPTLADLSVSPLVAESGETIVMAISGTATGSAVTIEDQLVGWILDGSKRTITLTTPEYDDDTLIDFGLIEAKRPALNSPHRTGFQLLVKAKYVPPPVDLEPYRWGDPRLAWGQSDIAWGQLMPDGATSRAFWSSPFWTRVPFWSGSTGAQPAQPFWSNPLWGRSPFWR